MECASFSLACSTKSKGIQWPSLYTRDYVGHLLCAEGFKGSHQIRDWRIKLGDFKKGKSLRLRSVYPRVGKHQFNSAINTVMCISGQSTLSAYVLLITGIPFLIA